MLDSPRSEASFETATDGRALSVVARPNGAVRVASSIDLLMSGFARFISSEVALLYQLDGGGRPCQLSTVGVGAAHVNQTRLGEGGFVGRALSLKRAVLEPLDLRQDAELINARQPPLTYAAAAPIHLETGMGGLLIAAFARPPREREWTLWATESYAAMAALGLQAPEALDDLLAPARRDGLTGCLSYTALLDQLVREMDRSARGDLDLSVCFIDLDGFKRVNDRHGHLSGNKVLAEVAETLRHGMRSFDTVGRYGGDEFIAILPQTDERTAQAVAERLCSSIADMSISSDGPPLSAAVGVAQWEQASSAEQLLDRADAALLTAKAER